MKTKTIERSKTVWLAILSLVTQLITFFQGEASTLGEITGLDETTILLILGSISVTIIGLIRIFDTDSKIVMTKDKQ